MKIVTYCITFPDEADILPNMIAQASKLGDVWLFDGGRVGSHCQNNKRAPSGIMITDDGLQYAPEDIEIPDDAIQKIEGCRYTSLPWPGSPGKQRNAALDIMGNEYDWIIQNDSDEVWTDQAVEMIPKLLGEVSHNITNILVKMLHLVKDEDHYWRRHYRHLVHARIHRPGSARWVEGWHEHQNYTGQRMSTDMVLLHTKHLFVNRLQRFYGKGLEMWGDLDYTPLPPGRFGLTWPDMVYPREDRHT